MNKQEYAAYLKSDHWKKLRSKKRSRTRKSKSGKNRCAICASVEKIQTHHLLYRNIFDVTTTDLRLLCDRCHGTAHELMKAGLRFNSDSHHSIFATLKTAVKKKLGFGNKNMFTEDS